MSPRSRRLVVTTSLTLLAIYAGGGANDHSVREGLDVAGNAGRQSPTVDSIDGNLFSPGGGKLDKYRPSLTPVWFYA